MKLDPKMLKEINKTVDVIVKKNKMAIDNARDIDKLLKKIEKLEDRMGMAELEIKLANNNIESNKAAWKAIEKQKLDKEMKAIQARLKKM